MSWRRLCLLVLGATIIMLANLSPGTVRFGTGYDKLDHALAFAVLAPVAAFAFPRVSVVRLFIALMIFNAGIEISQAILNLDREPDIVDWAVGVGATLPVLAVVAVVRIAHAKRKAS